MIPVPTENLTPQTYTYIYCSNQPSPSLGAVGFKHGAVKLTIAWWATGCQPMNLRGLAPFQPFILAPDQGPSKHWNQPKLLLVLQRPQSQTLQSSTGEEPPRGGDIIQLGINPMQAGKAHTNFTSNFKRFSTENFRWLKTPKLCILPFHQGLQGAPSLPQLRSMSVGAWMNC